MIKFKMFIKDNKFLCISILILIVVLIIAVAYLSNRFNSNNSIKNVIDEKEAIREYYCEDGEEYDSTNNTCSKYVEFEAEKEIECDYGYELDGDRCVNLETEDYGRYYCKQGVLQGTSCVITTTYNAQANKYCSETGYSYYYEGGGYSYCKYSGSSENLAKCSSGYTYSYATEKCYPKMPVLYKYYCNGAKRSDSPICEETKTVAAEYIEGCADGFERDGDKCLRKNYEEVIYVPICRSGFEMTCYENGLSDDDCTCSGMQVIEARYNMKCENDYELVDDKCVLYE